MSQPVHTCDVSPVTYFYAAAQSCPRAAVAWTAWHSDDVNASEHFKAARRGRILGKVRASKNIDDALNTLKHGIPYGRQIVEMGIA